MCLKIKLTFHHTHVSHPGTPQPVSQVRQPGNRGCQLHSALPGGSRQALHNRSNHTSRRPGLGSRGGTAR